MELVQGKEILHRTREMIDASVYGVIVLAILRGVLGGLAFRALGLPNPVLWGVVMVILSTIPVTGSFLVWIPAAAYLTATGSWGKGLMLAAWGLLVIGTVDNFLRPKVMGQKARITSCCSSSPCWAGCGCSASRGWCSDRPWWRSRSA